MPFYAVLSMVARFANCIPANLCGQERHSLMAVQGYTENRASIDKRNRTARKGTSTLVHWLTLILSDPTLCSMESIVNAPLYLYCRERDRLWQVKEYSALDAESPKAEFALCSCRIHVKTA